MRSATTAAASRKKQPVSNARWKPDVSAAGNDVWPASRWVVRDVAIAEKIASPSALPICCDELSSAAASPALSADTPALAAVVTPTKTAPRPNDTTSSPGRRSVRYEPSVGISESQYKPADAISAPAMTTGRVPTRASSCEEIPAAMPTPTVNGRYAEPARIGE